MFRRPAPLPPEVETALDRLSQLAEAAPELREAGALQAALLRAAYARPPTIGPFAISPERAAEKRAAGQPLLRGEHVPIDAAALGEQIARSCQAGAAHLAQPADAEAIAAALRRGALSPAALARHALAGTAEAMRAEAAGLGVNGELLGTLVRLGLFPALARLANTLAPLHGAARWPHGTCPTCGSPPLLAEQRGLEQLRFLRCGLCANEWQADRLWCPFCGSRDHGDLGYVHAEGDEQRRAATCDRCHSYLKVISTLGRLAPPSLLAEDVASLHLDMIALERGYAGPA